MQRRIFRSIALLLTMLIVGRLPGQTPAIPYRSVNIASPTAASLGKFVDQPVNYGQGLPEISYPIYEVAEGPLKLPVSLNYHAQGIKVAEPASWVGANWSLNAGGVITRSVRGAPDEKQTNDAYNNNHGYYSNFGISGVGMVNYAYPNWTATWGWDWTEISAGNKDGEPDFYTFSMPGYSGKFCFSDDRTPIFFPAQDIKIEVEYTGSGSFQSFVLTVPDGTRYYFGRTASTTDVDPVEITKVSSEDNMIALGNIISSWFLHKIESADRLFSINLVYSQERYSYLGLMFKSLHEQNNIDKEYQLIKNTVLGVRLQSIQFSNGRVDFVPGTLREDLLGFSNYQLQEDANTEAKTLSSISVYRGDNSLLKSFNLSTSYTVDNTSPLNGAIQSMYYSLVNDKKKLRLNSVTEVNSLGQSLPPTSYEYFPETVTRRLSFGQDHWGYANGVTSNSKMIATYTENTYTVVAGANREPVWPQMRGGSLKRINLPTGGYVDFDMEPNQVWVSKSVLGDVFNYSLQVSYTSSQTSPAQTTRSLSVGQHKIALSSNGGSATAYATVRSTSGTHIVTIAATPGQSTNAMFNIPTAGNYIFEVTKPFTSSGNGATATLYTQQYVDQSENMMAGGLRVKTITQVDNGPSPDIVTNFEYNYNGKSTAALYGRPSYAQVLRNDIIKNQGFIGVDGAAEYNCSLNGCLTCDNQVGLRVAFYKSPGILRTMDNLQGSHIGYTEVKVSKTNNGHSIFRYYGPPPQQMDYRDVVDRNVVTTYCDANNPNYPQAPLPFDYTRGELKATLNFNQNGDLLKQVIYNYSYDTVLNVSAPGTLHQKFVFGSGTQLGGGTVNTSAVMVVGTNYSLGTKYKKYAAIYTQELVPGQGYIEKVDTVFYSSPYHRQQTKLVTINSGGFREEKQIKYAADYRNSACDAIADCSAAYNAQLQNCWNIKVAAEAVCAAYQYVPTDPNAKQRCYAEAKCNYEKCRQDARYAWAATCRQNYLNPALSGSYPYCQLTARNNASGDLKPIYHLRDIYANPPVEITDWTAGKLTSAQYIAFYKEDVNGYMITPDKDYTIPLTAGLTNFAPTYVSGNSIVKDGRYAQENDIDIAQGLLRTVTKKDGLPRSYRWDATGTFPVAVATGAAETNMAYSSFEDAAKGSFVYAGTPTLVSTAPFPPTGKYYLALNGSTSVLSRAVVNGASYTLSYWRNSSNPFTISGATVQATRTGVTLNGWTFFEQQLQATGTSLSINQAGAIDEVRLYPYGATMTSYTYNKPVGIATESNEQGVILYYEYDAFNRLLQVKDMRGRVIKRMDYLLNQTY